MECFASNAAIDPRHVRVTEVGFGVPITFGQVATVRGLLSTEEAEQRLGALFTVFMQELHHEHARGELRATCHWAIQGITNLRDDVALALRVFRELLPQAFLSSLFDGPRDRRAGSQYLMHSLDELRGINGTLVFSGTARVLEQR